MFFQFIRYFFQCANYIELYTKIVKLLKLASKLLNFWVIDSASVEFEF